MNPRLLVPPCTLSFDVTGWSVDAQLCFSAGTGWEGGHIAPSLRTMSRIVRGLVKSNASDLSQLSGGDLNGMMNIADQMIIAARFDEQLQKGVGDAQVLLRVAARAADECADLEVGASMLLPGGWLTKDGGHAIMFLVERQQENSFLFAVINTGAGVRNHPHSSLKQPLEASQARTAIAMKGISKDRISDRGLWALVYGKCFSIYHNNSR